MFTVGAIISDFFGKAIRGFFLLIDSIVYGLAATTYRLFMLVSEINLFDFSDQNTFGPLVSRIYTILGIVMLFVFAYNILTLIANPDKLSNNDDKSLSGILKNTVISILLIVLLPTIFNFAQKIQMDILRSNVIGNIILGGQSTKDGDLGTAGIRVASTVFSAFYHPLDDDGRYLTPQECAEDRSKSICEDYLTKKAAAEDNEYLAGFILDSDLNKAVSDGKMKYTMIASTIAGCIVLYLFLSFTIDLGVRAAKLAALQIIAPIPIMARITKPKGGIFSKWLKELTDTYLMVFIRVAIVYFVVFTIEILISPSFVLFGDNFNSGSGPDGGPFLRFLAKVVLIMGILKFAKDAPKLLETIIGTNGKVTWKIKDKLNENEYAKRAAVGLGAVGGTLARSVLNPFSRNAEGKLQYDWKKLGTNMGRLPGGIFRSFGRGVANGNVDISQIGTAAGNVASQTQNYYDNRDARFERLRPFGTIQVENDDGEIEERARRIFGLSGLGVFGANLAGKIESHLTDNAWIDELVEKFNRNRDRATNETLSNAFKLFDPIRNYLEKDIEKINNQETKAQDEAAKQRRMDETAAKERYNSAVNAAKEALGDNPTEADTNAYNELLSSRKTQFENEMKAAKEKYDETKKANKEFYDARRDEQRADNLEKYKDVIGEIFGVQNKDLVNALSSLSQENQSSIFNDNTKIKNIDQLVEALSKNNLNSLSKDNLTELTELAGDLGDIGKTLKKLNDNSSSIFGIEQAKKAEKKGDK